MKVINRDIKRKLNHSSPGMWDARLGDLIEALQEKIISLEQRVAELEGTGPVSGGGGSAGSGSSTWETA